MTRSDHRKLIALKSPLDELCHEFRENWQTQRYGTRLIIYFNTIRTRERLQQIPTTSNRVCLQNIHKISKKKIIFSKVDSNNVLIKKKKLMQIMWKVAVMFYYLKYRSKKKLSKTFTKQVNELFKHNPTIGIYNL